MPSDVLTYEYGSDKLKIIRPIYDFETDEFKRLEEMFGLCSVSEDTLKRPFLIMILMRKNRKSCIPFRKEEFLMSFVELC